jgi:hypothetical protein
VRQLENAIEMAIAISGERDVLYPKDFGFNSIKILAVSLVQYHWRSLLGRDSTPR